MRTFAVSPVNPASRAFDTLSAAEQLRGTQRAITSVCNAPELLRFGQYTERMHPVLQAVAFAYGQHYPLTLAPDDVWLCLVQGLALHVQENAEAQRERFVRHKEKKAIEVETSVDPGQDAEAWRGMIDALTEGVAGEIGKKRDLFVASFSTTGPVERAAFQIAMLDTLQHFFSYSFIVVCGIPSITLLGTPDDWRDLRKRAAVLGEFGLEAWTAVILDILDHFVAASEGNVDLEFWESIYKQTVVDFSGRRMCGAEKAVVTGWINVLLSTACTAPLSTWMKHESGNLHTSFTMGLSVAPFVKRYLGQEADMELVAGFVGISQEPKTLALRPAMGWFVREKRDGAGRVDDDGALPRSPNEPVDLTRLPSGAGQHALQVSDADAATHYDLGVAYLEMGMLQDAIDEFDIAARAPAYAEAALAKKGEALLALEEQAKVAR